MACASVGLAMVTGGDFTMIDNRLSTAAVARSPPSGSVRSFSRSMLPELPQKGHKSACPPLALRATQIQLHTAFARCQRSACSCPCSSSTAGTGTAGSGPAGPSHRWSHQFSSDDVPSSSASCNPAELMQSRQIRPVSGLWLISGRQRRALSLCLSAAFRSVRPSLHDAVSAFELLRSHFRLALGHTIPTALALAPGGTSGQWRDLASNHVFLVGFWAWLFAQTLKIFTRRAKTGVWDVRAIVDSGGMPSSHSALCTSVTTAVGLEYGLGSPLFALALCFSLIVMYDATGVRRHAGKQAEVLNIMLGEILEGHPVRATKLKEVLGHTPLQVAAGAIIGVVVGCLFPQPSVMMNA